MLHTALPLLLVSAVLFSFLFPGNWACFTKAAPWPMPVHFNEAFITMNDSA